MPLVARSYILGIEVTEIKLLRARSHCVLKATKDRKPLGDCDGYKLLGDRNHWDLHSN